MWTAEIQDGNTTVSSTTTGTSNDHKRPLDLSINEAKQPLPNVFTTEADPNGDKRSKSSNSCEIHGKKFKTDKLIKDTIRKWQLCNLAKCVFNNTVNLVIESLPDDENVSSRENLNVSGPNFSLEDEAVLMAIEEHGLKQASECNCPEDLTDSSQQMTHSGASCSKSNFYECVSNAKNYFPEDDQEFNFEHNFMATAVSVAIEEKGLSMYHV